MGHVTARHNHTFDPALEWAMMSQLLQKKKKKKYSKNHTQCIPSPYSL